MGLSSAIHFNGELISQDKVLKETARYRDGRYLIAGSEEPRLPEGVTIQEASDEIPIGESEVSDVSAMVPIQDLESFRLPTQSPIIVADTGYSTYPELDFVNLPMQHSISRYSTRLNSYELPDWWESGSIHAQSPFTLANDSHLADLNFGIIEFPMPHIISRSVTPLGGEGHRGWLVANRTSLEFPHNFKNTIPLDTLSLIRVLKPQKIRGFNVLMRAIVERCVAKIAPLLSKRATEALQAKGPEDQFLQLIIMLFMNNFAGSNDSDFEDLFRQLQYFSAQQATHLLDAIPQPYNTALQQSILTIAIKFGAQSIVKILLQRDIDQNAIYCVSKGQTITPLQFACRRRNIEITRLLIKSGADVKRKDKNGRNTISHLLDLGLSKEATYPPTVGRILALLLEAGADAVCEQLSYLHFWNTQSVVDVFLNCGRTPDVHHNLNLITRALVSAFMCLDSDGALAATRILLGSGFIFAPHSGIDASVELSNAFTVASLKGHEGVVEFFLKAEFKPRPESLAAAVEGNSMTIVRRLLKHGLRPDSVCVGSRHHFLSRPIIKVIQSSLHLTPTRRPTERTTPFAEAVRFQHQEAIQLFQKELDSVFNIVEPTKSNNFLFYTLLNAASEVGDIEMIENLFHRISCSLHVSYIREQDRLVMSCFPLATVGHHVAAVNILLENGAYPEGSDCLTSALMVQDQTLLRLFLDLAVPFGADPVLMWLAVRWGNLDVIQDLIDAGASLHGYLAEIPLTGVIWRFPYPFTNSLGEALRKQDRQVTQLLLRNGADFGVDFGTERSSQFGGCSPLTVAVQSGDINTVQDLLSYGADPNDPGALLEAASQSPMMVQAILEAFDRRYQKFKTLLACKALRKAIRDGKLAEVSLFSKYTDLNDKFQSRENEVGEEANPLGYSPPHSGNLPSPLGEGIAGCNLEIIEILHNSGGDINSTVVLEAPTPFRGRWLAIHQAIYTKNLAVVQLLSTLGARVNCKVELGITRTPLQLATQLGSYEIVEFLIRHCDADVNAEPCIWNGRTALQLAASLCFVQIAELLLKYGADINAPRGKYEGRTAFEGAAEHGRIEMLLFLSNSEFNLRLDREQVCRAMELATKNGQPAAAELVRTISESSNLSLRGFSPLAIT
jgi:ankyrin repeat protein